MLSKDEARDILIFKYEGIRVESGIDLDDRWVFRAFLPIGGGEENMNPFFSVEKATADVSDFSITAYENPMALMALFGNEDGDNALNKPLTPQEALIRGEED